MWAADDRLAWLLDRDLLYKAGFAEKYTCAQSGIPRGIG